MNEACQSTAVQEICWRSLLGLLSSSPLGRFHHLGHGTDSRSSLAILSLRGSGHPPRDSGATLGGADLGSLSSSDRVRVEKS